MNDVKNNNNPLVIEVEKEVDIAATITTNDKYKYFQNKECPFFPCHKNIPIEQFNCLFCFCPLYSLKERCGGNYRYLKDGTKDCSQCLLPHVKGNYNYIIKKLALVTDVVKKNKIIFASNSQHKAKEFQEMLDKYGYQIRIITLKEINYFQPIEETGKTFSENALIKARTVSQLTKLPVFADDSGICVEGLDNFPGINSARWLEEKTYAEKNEELIKKVNNLNNRKAHYFCSIAFVDFVEQKEKVYEEKWEGEIATSPKGENGFGYDPIFFLPELNKTAAELTSEEKNNFSHRAKAFKKFIDDFTYRFN